MSPTKQEAMTCTTGSGCEDCHWLDIKRKKIKGLPNEGIALTEVVLTVTISVCGDVKQANKSIRHHLYLYGGQFKNPP